MDLVLGGVWSGLESLDMAKPAHLVAPQWKCVWERTENREGEGTKISKRQQREHQCQKRRRRSWCSRCHCRHSLKPVEDPMPEQMVVTWRTGAHSRTHARAEEDSEREGMVERKLYILNITLPSLLYCSRKFEQSGVKQWREIGRRERNYFGFVSSFLHLL